MPLSWWGPGIMSGMNILLKPQPKKHGVDATSMQQLFALEEKGITQNTAS